MMPTWMPVWFTKAYQWIYQTNLTAARIETKLDLLMAKQGIDPAVIVTLQAQLKTSADALAASVAANKRSNP